VPIVIKNHEDDRAGLRDRFWADNHLPAFVHRVGVTIIHSPPLLSQLPVASQLKLSLPDQQVERTRFAGAGKLAERIRKAPVKLRLRKWFSCRVVA
jgi:hypothetical protein